MALGSIGSTGSSPTDFDIRDLNRTQDNILIYANTAADGTGTNLVPLVDAAGNLQIDVLTMPAVTIAGGISVDTEFPAAAVLADNMANPSTTLVGSCLLAWDTATWDRVQIGTGTAAASLRVTVATDVGLPAGTNNIGDVDVLSVVPGTAATNLGKAEDAIHASGDTGVMALAVRRDVAAASSGIDGDYEPLSTDNTGRLRIAAAPANSGVDIGDVDILSIAAGDNNIGNVDVLSVIPGTGATNSGKAVDSVAGATDTGSASLAVRDDILGALIPIEGDYVNLRTDANGALWTHDDALDAALAGAELQVDIVASLPAGVNNIGDIDVLSIAAGDNNIGNVDVLSVIPGTAATNLGKAEDAIHVTGDTGVFMLGVRQAANAPLSGTDGDYEPLQLDANGHLKINIIDALPTGANVIGALTANQSVNVAQMGGVATSMNTGVRDTGTQRVTVATNDIVQVVGELAHDAVDSGNPVKIGGIARTANPTAVAALDRVNATYDDIGRLITHEAIRDLKTFQATTITASVAETTIVTAGAAGVFLDLYGLMISNTSATTTSVTIRDATAGTTRMIIRVPANDVRGFMLAPSAAHNQATAANNWTAQSADSVSSLQITAFCINNV